MRAPTRCAYLFLALFLPLWGSACGDDQSAPVAASVTISGGDGQEGAAGSTLSQPVTVRVADDQNDPVPGVSVAWSVTAGGGSVSPAQSESGADGTASTTWTLGATAGEQRVRAAVEGGGSVTFTATATPGAPASVTVSPEALEFDGVGQSETLDVTVKDEHGNDLGDTDVTFSSSDESVATVDQEGVVTAQGSGEAEITVAAGSVSATVPVTVSVATFEPEGDVTVSGTVAASEMNVGEGITVTASGPVTLAISGTATVAGTITGECQPITLQGGTVTVTGTISNGCPGSPEGGADLTITSAGALEISGAELVSDGNVTISNTGGAAGALRAAAIEPLVPGLAAQQASGDDCFLSGIDIRPVSTATETLPLNGPFDAPDVDINCGGHLSVLTPTIRTGWGGSALGQPFDGEGDYPSGTAADGGSGGDVILEAPTIEIAGGNYHLGGGGDGGDWYANGADPEAIGGNGGTPGRWLLYAEITSTVGLPAPTVVINPAGDGGDATAVGDPGSDAIAQGGDGGSLGSPDAEFTFAINTDALDEDFKPMFVNGRAGDGGSAHVIPGDGTPGTYQDPEAGDAGNGTASSGDGGNIFLDPIFDNTFDGNDTFLPGNAGGMTFEGGNGGMGGGSCRVDRPVDRAGPGSRGGSAAGTPGQPGARDGLFGEPGDIIFDGFGNGGPGGRANDPGEGGEPGDNPFADRDPPPLFPSGSFLPGPTGDDCLFGGPITMTVKLDPSGHEPFTRYTSVTHSSWTVVPPGEGGGRPTIQIDGDGPWVPISGTLDLELPPLPLPETPIYTRTTFMGEGRGPVAGYPDIRVAVVTGTLRFDDDLLPGGWNGEIEVGADGGLPGGQAERLDADASGSLGGAPPQALVPFRPGAGEEAGEEAPAEVRAAVEVPLRPEPRPAEEPGSRTTAPWSPPWEAGGAVGEEGGRRR